MEKLSKETLSELIEDRDISKISKLGGSKGISSKVGTDLSNGLSRSEKELDSFHGRSQRFGRNIFPERAPKSFTTLLLESLNDTTLIILIISALVSLILGVTVEKESGGWIEGTAILGAVCVVSFVTAGNDYSKEKQFRKLNAARENKQIKVVRFGTHLTIPISDLLVGDVIELEAGDKISADGIVFESDDLQIDESSMTGETDSVKKSAFCVTQEGSAPCDPFALCGCQVMSGRGRMLTLAVGSESQWGKIKALVSKDDEETPLQEHLTELAETIGKMGMVAAFFTFLVLFIKWLSTNLLADDFEWESLGDLVDYLITAITIVVVAVPEGLPLAVTISLAYSVQKMMKDNNLVRHLEACETMGGATNICSDKTGTLTENRMTVVKAFLCQQFFEDIDEGIIHHLSDSSQTLLAEGVCVNSTAFIVSEEDQQEQFVGSKTECALLQFSEKLGYHYDEIRSSTPCLRMFPFSSAKKRMTTLMPPNKNLHRIWMKGASEIVLDMCVQGLNEKGKVVELSGQFKEAVSKHITEMASTGLRTLGLAYADVKSSEIQGLDDSDDPQASFENAAQFILIGVVGIKDPVRKEVPSAVKTCQRAGITVRMLTGDNILTAQHIAQECGILHEDGEAIEGPKFRKLSDREVDSILPKLQVMARCSPQDKFRLVNRLRQMGEVVAVTGDGTNDAPQLKEADVGFAMGIAGTEVAKEASDIILLDDNFTSIVKAVSWGRNVFDSIRKFVQFQTTVNIVAVIVAFVGAVTHGDSPLTAVQMLWVNLIMDTLAALALATETPTPDLLLRKPYGRTQGIITRTMWRNILSQAFYQLSVLFFLLYGAHKLPFLGLPPIRAEWSPETFLIHGTIVFNCFVFCQIFNEINSRKLDNQLNVFKGFFRNPIFLFVIVFTIAVQFFCVEFGGDVVNTRPLNANQWAFCIIVGFISLPYGLLTRIFIPVAYQKEAPPPKVVDPLARFRAVGKRVAATHHFLAAVNQEKKQRRLLKKDSSFLEGIRRRRR